MKRTRITTIFLTLLVLSLAACTKTQKESEPTIAVTTFALYDITKHIANENVNIVNILPFGVEPHEYEPTPKLVASLEKSALVLYSGAGLEPWTDGFTFKHKAINMSKYVTLGTLQGSYVTDPHYWLDFENMKIVTEVITKELIAISPENKTLYLKNEENYLQMLKKLDSAFQTQLGTCKRDTIVVNHNAFGYLAKEYNFHVESLSGLSPDAQPNAKNIIRLIKLIKEHNVSTVFFEDFASDKAIKGVANAAQTQVDILKPLGNITADEAKKNLSYEAMMKINLEKISKALSCR